MNNTRIVTTNTEFTIPLIYSKGYLIYRVRGISRFDNGGFNTNYYGPWSSTESIKTFVSDWPHTYIVLDHDTGKNWQFQASYAEEGKKKEVVSYFDGSLRNRQTVTKINSDENAVVGEVIYDAQGRPAIEVLPVPTIVNKIQYYPNFNQNDNSTPNPFSHLDFDWEDISTDPNQPICNIEGVEMNDNSGSSLYYSENNTDFITRKNHSFISNANGYPYSQIEYTADNTGRIARKGGVGENHQLDTGHEMKYFYTKPNQKELNRLFGYSVGNATHYKKNIVVDPNGQVSISYIDPQGRTIATALAGGAPSDEDGSELLDALDDALDSATITNSSGGEDQMHGLFNADLLDKLNLNDFDTNDDNNYLFNTGNYLYNDGLRYFGSQFNSKKSTSFTFNYSAKGKRVFTIDCINDETIGYPFVYNLKLDALDNCGTSVLTSGVININLESEPSTSNTSYVNCPKEYDENGNLIESEVGLYTLVTAENDFSFYDNQIVTVPLEVGNYNISKEVTIDNVILDKYADDYINRLKVNGCIICPDALSPEAALDGCFKTCEECVIELGDLVTYVINHLELHGIHLGTNASGNFYTGLEGYYSDTSDFSNQEIQLLIDRYVREHELLIIECNRPCQVDGVVETGDNTPILSLSCETKRGRLLADVSPSGQYGYYSQDDDDTLGSVMTLETHPLSLYNKDTNQLFFDYVMQLQTSFGNGYSSLELPFSWKTPYNVDYATTAPKHYYDNNGEIVYVLIQVTQDELGALVYTPEIDNPTHLLDADIEGFKKIEPQYLSDVADFENLSDNSWANSLLIYHPEYAYLVYEQAVCQLTNALDFQISGNTANYTLTPDGYTNLLQSLTFDDAVANGYFGNSSTLNFNSDTIIRNDPFFKDDGNHLLTIEGTNAGDLFIKRTNIITEAMLIGANGSGNYNGSGKTAFELAFQSIYCNNLSSCDLTGIDFNDVVNNVFTQEQRNDLWFKYVSFYISERSKIKSVFANIHAKNNGVYNGCIDDEPSVPSNILSPLSVYNLSGLSSYINEPASNLCDSQASQDGYYLEKERIFLPSDALYDSSQSNQANVDEMTGWMSYYTYTQTGVCPKASYMDFFFSGLNQNMSSIPNFTNFEINYSGAYLNPELITDIDNLFDFQNPSTVKIKGEVASSELKLMIEKSPSLVTLLVLNENASLPWDTYGSSVWTINSFYQFTYTSYDNVNNRFNFSVLANVSTNSGTQEVLFEGYTYAKIGECTLNGNNNGIGDDLGDGSNAPSEVNNCSKKSNFENGLLFLVNYLNQNNLINNSNINLLNYPIFTDNTLFDFILADIGNVPIDEATWNVTSSGYEIIVKGEDNLGNSITEAYLLDISLLNSGVLFDAISITTNTNSINDHAILFSYLDDDFINQNFSGTVSSLNQELNFSCCKIITQNVNNQPAIESLLADVLNELIVEWQNSQPSFIGSYSNTYIDQLYQYIDGYNPSITITPNIYYENPSHITIEYKKLKCFIKFFLNEKFDGITSIDNIIISTSNPNSFEIYFTTNYGPRIAKGETGCKFLLNSEVNQEVCDFGCIPQVVIPVSCTDKYAYFINAYTSIFGANTLPVHFTEEHFCNMKYAYIAEGYIQYLQVLGITNYDNPYYLSIDEFGATALNYGFDLNGNGYDEVINQFQQFIANGGELEKCEYINWGCFVNNVFLPSNPNICPPKPLQISINVIVEDPNSDCVELHVGISEAYNNEAYQNFINLKKEKFKKDYIEAAFAELVENLNVTYFDKEYQYTLYYYDQAGNLTQTVAPEGVKRLSTTELTNKNDLINNYRNDNGPLTNPADDLTLQPEHSFKTEYKYNSLNQLVWQYTPDGGETRFAYDKLGRIIASQNAKQVAPRAYDGPVAMSYTVYDELGRITEAGEIGGIPSSPSAASSYYISDLGTLIHVENSGGRGGIITENQVDGFPTGLIKTEVTRTVYDTNPEVESNKFSTDYFITLAGVNNDERDFNNRNRVTGIFYYDTYNELQPLEFDNGIFYNYDVHGNVKEQVSYYKPLRDYGCRQIPGQLNDCEAHLKRVIYDYDLISGNVNRVTFQPNWKGEPNKTDLFIHKYEYDADNRIVNVQTSADGIIWEKDAQYEYFAHGPLSRVEIGNKNVQGIDYAYTLQGWLKAVNGENLASPQNDMGLDGTPANVLKAKDAFGYSLNYFGGDYKAIDASDDGTSAFNPLMISRNATGSSNRNLYNGNIKQMVTAVRQVRENLKPIQKNNYTYDQLNRITGMTSNAFKENNAGVLNSNPSYQSSYSYDRNGNLVTLNRTAPTENNFNSPFVQMDNFTYKYNTDVGNNQLTKVFDAADDLFGDGVDIKKNIAELATYNENDANSHNYIYDEIGQLVQDKSEDITISWRVDGKVKTVYKDAGRLVLDFIYDGLGNRIAKKESKIGKRGNDKITTTFYSRDAQGNVLGVYTIDEKNLGRGGRKKELTLNEHLIYGSSRLGLEDKELLVYQSQPCLHCKNGEEPQAPVINAIAPNIIVGNSLNLDRKYEWPSHTVEYEALVRGNNNNNNGPFGQIQSEIINNKYINVLTINTKTLLSIPTPTIGESAPVELSNINELRTINLKMKTNSHPGPQIIGKVLNISQFKLEAIKDSNENYALQLTVFDDLAYEPDQLNGVDYSALPQQIQVQIPNGGRVIEKVFKTDFIYPATSLAENPEKGLDIAIVYNNTQPMISVAEYDANGDGVFGEEILFPLIATNTALASTGYLTVPNSVGSNSNSNASLCNFNYTISDAVSSNVDITGSFTFNGFNSSNNIPGTFTNSNINNARFGTVILNGSPVSVSTVPVEMSYNTALPESPFTIGACLYDTDGDGLYDLYEVQANTSTSTGAITYTSIDTDNDGTPNHLDIDDDGDGIESKYENNHTGNHNPVTALDTDGDGIKNYLDVDDDNDGYATWETLEGGPDFINPTIQGDVYNTTGMYDVTGLAYTLDTDLDTIPNYLDNTNGNFQVTGPISISNFVSLIGDKRYELSNHLGNVLVVINDKKLPEFNIEDTPSSGLMAFNADVLSYNDYYPFGMLVPNRTSSSTAYRYGFNGMEKDDELKGIGNSYDFGARMYDSRIGRWFAPDKKEAKYSNISTYVPFSDNPIFYIDSDGNEFINAYKDRYNKSKIDIETARNKYLEIVNEITDRKLLKAAEKELKKMEKDFSNLESKYLKVERLLYTLKTINPDEYNYFETLTDSEGENVKINIDFDKSNDPSKESDGVSASASTRIAGDFKMVKTPNGGRDYIVVGVLDNEIDISLYSQSLEWFGNELGDIKYFFTYVKTKKDFDYFVKTGDGINNDFDAYQTEKGGAGKYSFDFQKIIKGNFDKYVKDKKLEKDKHYNKNEQTLNLPEDEN
ncbi:RHS repeat-associated core domain-containing protein [Flavobacterium sp. N2270]|uniref:RHS repeat-associated core domain-containing protein n=1 Tax=Flavobacterium sp. N2270 TaxID=2986831 RepID=UPI00222472D7|nr:RHS repeat-associated core domain-containing protein [Flavobacterium sp. N2270]